jgi:hypothetical protein
MLNEILIIGYYQEKNPIVMKKFLLSFVKELKERIYLIKILLSHPTILYKLIIFVHIVE